MPVKIFRNITTDINKIDDEFEAWERENNIEVKQLITTAVPTHRVPGDATTETVCQFYLTVYY